MQTKPFQHQYNESMSKNDIDYRGLYTSCFPMVRSMVLKNSGTIDDARDIFQEAIMVLYQNSSFDKFQLTAVTSTYLYSIARNKWLKQLRYNGRLKSIDEDDDVADDSSLIEDDERKQKQRLLAKHLANIGEKCQGIIKRFFEGIANCRRTTF